MNIVSKQPQSIKILLHILDNKIIPTQQNLYDSLKYNSQIEEFEIFLNYGCVIDTKCLEIAFSEFHTEMIYHILNKAPQINISQNCFKSLIINKINRNIDPFEIDYLANFLIKKGYQLTDNDILSANRHNIKLKIPKNLKTPPIKTNNIISLQLACKEGKYQQVKLLINSGLKPDIICLENAFNCKQNIQVVRTIMKANPDLKPTFNCIRNMAIALDNKTFNFLIELMKKDQNIGVPNIGVPNIDDSESESDSDIPSPKPKTPETKPNKIIKPKNLNKIDTTANT